MNQEGLQTSLIEHGGVRESFATVLPAGGDGLASSLRPLGQLLGESGGQVLEVRVFGAVEAFPPCVEALRELLGEMDWPLVFIQGDAGGGGEIAGVQLHSVAGAEVETVRLDGRPVGRVFESRFARYCVLGGLQSADPSRSRERQTRETLEKMFTGLGLAGMDSHCIARTWFFIDQILRWYSEFNGVRSEVYSGKGLFRRYLPASTGIGGANPDGAAVVASVLGIQAKEGDVTVREIASPLQCPALNYGSSFSRAAEVETPHSRHVLVSGTASIDPDGKTAHKDDVDAQIAYTLEIVGAILESRGMGFHHVARGNAYFKNSPDAARLGRHAAPHGLPVSQVVSSQNDVCRDDLLFELEVEAVKARED